MSTTFKGLVASLAFATSMISAGGPASAQTLASLGLDQNLNQCNLRLARRAMSLDLAIPENLSGITESFCGCEVVTVQMIEYLQRHRHLEILLDATAQQCPGFTRTLTNVATASTGALPGETDGGEGGEGGDGTGDDDRGEVDSSDDGTGREVTDANGDGFGYDRDPHDNGGGGNTGGDDGDDGDKDDGGDDSSDDGDKGDNGGKDDSGTDDGGKDDGGKDDDGGDDYGDGDDDDKGHHHDHHHDHDKDHDKGHDKDDDRNC